MSIFCNFWREWNHFQYLWFVYFSATVFNPKCPNSPVIDVSYNNVRRRISLNADNVRMWYFASKKKNLWMQGGGYQFIILTHRHPTQIFKTISNIYTTTQFENTIPIWNFEKMKNLGTHPYILVPIPINKWTISCTVVSIAHFSK